MSSHLLVNYNNLIDYVWIIIIIAASTCTHGEVRLIGGYTDHDGVAEVCINGFWADICDDVSDKATLSRTFCRQLMGEGSCTYIIMILLSITDMIIRQLQLQYILTQHAAKDNETLETLHSIVSHAVVLQESSFKTAHIKLYLVIPQQDAVFKKHFLSVAMNHPVAH